MRILPTSPLALCIATVVASFTMACASPPPPPKAPEPPPPVVAPPPVVREAPKCEALGENCAAAADTKARINRAGLAITPPAGWVFAQEPEATVAQASGDGPALAFNAFDADAKEPKKEAASREIALVDLLMHLGLTLDAKTRPSWKKADDHRAVGDLKLDLWDLETGVARGAQKGSLLVTMAQLGSGRALLGAGFVPEKDTSGAADAIVKAFDSLTHLPPGAPQ